MEVHMLGKLITSLQRLVLIRVRGLSANRVRLCRLPFRLSFLVELVLILIQSCVRFENLCVHWTGTDTPKRTFSAKLARSVENPTPMPARKRKRRQQNGQQV